MYEYIKSLRIKNKDYKEDIIVLKLKLNECEERYNQEEI